MFVSEYHIVYHFLDNVSLCKGKTATKLALGFSNCIFFVVWLPHWIPDLSLNAQPNVNKSYLIFIYITSFYDEAVSNVQQILIVCIVFYLFLWYYTVDQFVFAMLSYNTSIVS